MTDREKDELEYTSSRLIEKLKFHPETELFFRKLGDYGITSESNMVPPTVELARSYSQMLTEHMAGNVQFTGSEYELTVQCSHLQDGIPVTVYTPDGICNNPSILVYFHGGGFVVGSRKTCDGVCKSIALKVPCIVMNVEYRLAPEHKSPAWLDDGAAVVKWAIENKEAIGGTERSRMGVAGDSSGGYIALNIAHEVTGIDYQVLVYPSVDLGAEKPSMIRFKDGPVMTRDEMHWYFQQAFSEQDRYDVRTNATMRKYFNEQPPSLFIVAEYDPVLSHSYEYEKLLREAGVETELMVIEGAVHSFFPLSDVYKTCCEKSYSKIAEFIQAHSHNADHVT